MLLIATFLASLRAVGLNLALSLCVARRAVTSAPGNTAWRRVWSSHALACIASCGCSLTSVSSCVPTAINAGSGLTPSTQEHYKDRPNGNQAPQSRTARSLGIRAALAERTNWKCDWDLAQVWPLGFVLDADEPSKARLVAVGYDGERPVLVLADPKSSREITRMSDGVGKQKDLLFAEQVIVTRDIDEDGCEDVLVLSPSSPLYSRGSALDLQVLSGVDLRVLCAASLTSPNSDWKCQAVVSRRSALGAATGITLVAPFEYAAQKPSGLYLADLDIETLTVSARRLLKQRFLTPRHKICSVVESTTGECQAIVAPVFDGSSLALIAFSVEDGRKLWRQQVPYVAAGSYGYDLIQFVDVDGGGLEDIVFAWFGRDVENLIICVSAESGIEIWRTSALLGDLPMVVSIGDCNADGLSELVVSGCYGAQVGGGEVLQAYCGASGEALRDATLAFGADCAGCRGLSRIVTGGGGGVDGLTHLVLGGRRGEAFVYCSF